MLNKVEYLWKQHWTLDLFQDFHIGENVLQNAMIEVTASSGSMMQWIAIYLRTLSLLNLPPMITSLVRKIVLVMKKCRSLLMENVSTTSNQGAKYLVFVSSCSVKTRELIFAQFVNFLEKVYLFFKF